MQEKNPLETTDDIERLRHLRSLLIIFITTYKNGYWITDTLLVVVFMNNSNWGKLKSLLSKTIDNRLAAVSKEAGTFPFIKEQKPLKQKDQMSYEKLQTEQLNKLQYWFFKLLLLSFWSVYMVFWNSVFANTIKIHFKSMIESQ